MSFEMKYDAEGMPITPKIKEEVAIESTEQTEESIEHLSAETPEQTPPDNGQQEHKQEQKIENKRTFEPPKESWVVLREKAERAERRAQELEEAIKLAQSKPQESEEDLSFSVNDDDFVEGKHLSKVDKKIRKLEQQLKQYEQKSSVTTTEALLKSKYPDFDSIVSAENLANLRALYPEMANTINADPDLYSKAVTAYTMLKKLGIAQEDHYIEEKLLAQKNASKPKTLASISPQQGDSPLSKANAFANGKISDEMKMQLWKEMNEYRK